MAKNGYINTCTTIARGILHDRALRRKMIIQLGVFMLLLVVVGTWVISDWLDDSVWRFGIFWGIVTVYVLLVLLLCLYDMLRSIKEIQDEEK